MLCVCVCVGVSLRGGERQQRSGLEAVAEAAGPGGAAAAGKPGRPTTAGRRLRGHSLRYLPAAGKETSRRSSPSRRRIVDVSSAAPPTHRGVVVKTDVRASSVPRSLHQFTLLRAVRWAWVGSQGGGGSSDTEGSIGQEGRGEGGGRIQCVSFCSSRPASHWLHSGFSATTNRRLVLVSLCAWNSLEGRSEGRNLEPRP